jgi:hypothetical protein
MVKATVNWMPLFSAETWLGIIGWWEVAIGVTFLWNATVRLAIALLALQMIGTFMPLVMMPPGDFSTRPYSVRADHRRVSTSSRTC